MSALLRGGAGRHVAGATSSGLMDYAEARAAFFTPREGEARSLDWSTPARRLRDAMEPIATICFWSEPAYDAYASVGLDFLSGYVWGRASALGEPSGSVAAAAFGVFEPGLIADLYDAGRAACSLADVRAAKLSGTTTALREVLGDPSSADGLAETVDALRAAADASPSVGRPFFAGWLSLPYPDDPWAQLWQACSTLRELRGDGHLAAVVGAGLDGLQANVLTELWVGWEPLAYTGSRAWSPDAMAGGIADLEARGLVSEGALTPGGEELRERIERLTDESVQTVLDSLGDQVDTVIERVDGWAAKVVESGWFPPDPYKRASG